MNDTTRLVGRIAAWTTAAVLGAGILGGYAQAQSGSGAQPQAQSAESTASPEASRSARPNASPKPSRSAKPKPKPRDRPKRKGRPVGRRVLHGETVVQTPDGVVTHVVQRGTVTAVSSTSITIRSGDGFRLTWTRNADTTVRTGPKDSEQRPLKVGDDVLALGVRRSASSVLAKRVRVVPEGSTDGAGEDRPAD